MSARFTPPFLSLSRRSSWPLLIGRGAAQPLAVHLFVVVHVGAALHGLPPAAMGSIPVDRRAQPVGERVARRPSELALDLARVDRVTAIVPEAIGDVADEVARLAERRQDLSRDVDVLALVAAAEVVDLADSPFAKHEVDAAT